MNVHAINVGMANVGLMNVEVIATDDRPACQRRPGSPRGRRAIGDLTPSWSECPSVDYMVVLDRLPCLSYGHTTPDVV